MKIATLQSGQTRPIRKKTGSKVTPEDSYQASGEPAPWLSSLKPRFRRFSREVIAPLNQGPIAQVHPEKAQIQSFSAAKNDFLEPSALHTVQIDFGLLDAEEFANLHSEFGGRSETIYDPEREYTVRDFLPPVLQALVNQDLELPEPVTLPDSESTELLPWEGNKTVDLTMNCHATSWEAARAYQGDRRELNIFLGEMVVMDNLLASDFEVLPDESDLKPGDIVAFEEVSDWARMTMLLHTAVYVGGGLYFEKPNTESPGEDAPYRLATREMLEKPVSDYSDGSFKSIAYRPRRELLSSQEAFGSHQLDEWALENGPLGLTTCSVLEQSMGGGILGEHATALAKVSLAKRDDGTYLIDL